MWLRSVPTSLDRSLSRAELVTCPGHEVQAPAIELVSWVMWLCTKAPSRWKPVTRSMLCCIGFVVEHGPLWDESSIDALMDAPVPLGPKRARRLDPALTSAVAAAAGSGDVLGRTGGAVARSLARVRKWGSKRVKKDFANKAVRRRNHWYGKAMREEASSTRTRVVSLAMDGTRVGGKDMFYSAMYLPETGRAFWCPPQARVANQNWCF